MSKEPVPTKKALKYQKYKSVRLSLPKSPLEYQTRRVYWFFQNLNRVLEVDPTAVPFPQYKQVLDEYIRLVGELEKRGLNTRAGRKQARQGVDAKNVGEVGKPEPAPALGNSLPFSMGAGVPSPDTPAEHRGDRI